MLLAMQNLRNKVMPAHPHDVPGPTECGQCGHRIDLGLPGGTGNACSLRCAWEKVRQEAGLRSDEYSRQAVCSPRATD